MIKIFSDATIKNMIYIFAALLSIYPLIEIVFNKKKKWWLRIIIIIALIFFWYVTKQYKDIIGTEDKQTTEKIKSRDSTISYLKATVNDLKSGNESLSKKSDTTNNYLNYMKDKVKNPIQKYEYNTHINKADKVQIGAQK